MSTQTIQRLYDGLDRHDGAAMSACYAPDARFSDPVFTDLRGEEVGAMWRMLTARADELSVELVDFDVDGDCGTARWIARYPFAATGREVVNDVSSEFRFAGELIAEQCDTFDLWRWSRQALGPMGLLLGWSPIVRSRIRGQAAGQLAEFRAEEAAGGGPAASGA